MMKRLFVIVLSSLALTATVTGCRTAEGAGEDLENVGEEIQEKAEDMSQ